MRDFGWQEWAQLLGLLMVGILILPGALRMEWKRRRILIYIAVWLALFALAGLIVRLVM